MRTMVVGLDGASLRLIQPWVQQGKLPGFSRLMEEGAWGKLESVPNQRSAAAWTSFMTGKNPGKHGIFEFYDVVPNTYSVRFIHGGARDGATLWGLVSAAGRTVGVINVPMTYPAEKVDGFLVAGLDAPGVDSRAFTFPEDLYREVVKAVGGYTIEPGLTGCIVAGDVDMAVRRLHEELDQKIATTRYLMQRSPWDLLVTVFRSTDAAHHCFWKYLDEGHPEYNSADADRYGDVILSAYRKVDVFLQEILDEMDEGTWLLVMSDHGCGPKHPASNQLNQWLEIKGHLHSLEKSRGQRAHLAPLLGRLYRSVIGGTPRSVKESLWRWFPRLRDEVQTRLCFAGIDWSRTRAFSDTLFPIIRLNVRGREPKGIVEPGHAYRQLVEELKREIEQIRDAKSGEPIVDRVFQREEIYWGPHVEKAPDLLVRWREDISIAGIRLEYQGKGTRDVRATLIPGEDHRVISGDHTLYGVLLAWGKVVRKGWNLDRARLIDLAPTILYAMSIPVPEDMDGVELLDLFQEEFVEAHPRLKRRSSEAAPSSGVETLYSEEEEEKMRERLRGLGYIE